MLPAMFLIGHIDCMRRFLNALNVTYVPLIATVTTTSLHFLWLYLFIHMEITGIVLASSITFALQISILCLYSWNRLPDL
jgi:hypothetical protein